MALYDEVVGEIKKISKRSVSESGMKCDESSDKDNGHVNKKKPMTKEDIDAYRERKMREEENRYLKEMEKEKKMKKRKSQDVMDRKQKNDMLKDVAKSLSSRVRRSPSKKQVNKKIKNTKKSRRIVPSDPIGPLVPIHLLNIPGLPKGEMLAICIVRSS